MYKSHYRSMTEVINYRWKIRVFINLSGVCACGSYSQKFLTFSINVDLRGCSRLILQKNLTKILVKNICSLLAGLKCFVFRASEVFDRDFLN